MASPAHASNLSLNNTDSQSNSSKVEESASEASSESIQATGKISHRKKEVSFLDTNSESKIKVVDALDCLNYMQEGTDLLKIRPNNRHYKRHFFLDLEAMEIRWWPSSKKPHKAAVRVADIKEVRRGRTTAALRNSSVAAAQSADCAFTIVVEAKGDGDSKQRCIDLVAALVDAASVWITGLGCLINGHKEPGGEPGQERPQLMRDRWLEELFSTASLDSEGLLDEQSAIQLVKKFNTGVNSIRIRTKLKEVDLLNPVASPGRLSSSEFASLFKEIATRPEIYFLLVRYSSDGDCLSVGDLQSFIETEQGNPRITKERCIELINEFEPSSEGRRCGQLGIDGFTAYLQSEHCDILDPEHRAVCQDMSQPLANYFISASHKTFLMGDQLKSESSCDGYERALRDKVRYIELEVWDGADGEPIVYHGHTLTSKIRAVDALRTIRQFAFHGTDMPLIIGLENHCGLAQQALLVGHIRAHLSDWLLPGPATGAFTCPSGLRGRVLIKGRTLPDDAGGAGVDADDSFGFVSEEDERIDIQRDMAGRRVGHRRRIKLSRALSDLITLPEQHSLEFDVHLPMSSSDQTHPFVWPISESQSQRMAQADVDAFAAISRQRLVQVRPSAARVDSSNLNPRDSWCCGCQLVCLNRQSVGRILDLNRGHFSRNGACGFVLKPPAMRQGLPLLALPAGRLLRVRVISGSQLPKPRGSVTKGNVTDPYVQVELFGLAGDCATERTRTVRGNGFDPVFDEAFEFRVRLPELALLRFLVLDDDAIGDEFIGQMTVPVDCLQTGYRHVRLLSQLGEPLPNARLLVHVTSSSRPLSGKAAKNQRRRGGSGGCPRLKLTGLAEADESFRAASIDLLAAAELRDAFDRSLSRLREVCGLSSGGGGGGGGGSSGGGGGHRSSGLSGGSFGGGPAVKRCVRGLAGSAVSAGAALRMETADSWPSLELLQAPSGGRLPESLIKGLAAFEQVISEARRLSEQGPGLLSRLSVHEASCMARYSELENGGREGSGDGAGGGTSGGGCRPRLGHAKKAANFAWNVRVLRSQADQLARAGQAAESAVEQARQAGQAAGLLQASL